MVDCPRLVEGPTQIGALNSCSCAAKRPFADEPAGDRNGSNSASRWRSANVSCPYLRDIRLPFPQRPFTVDCGHQDMAGCNKIPLFLASPRALTVQTFFHGPLRTWWARYFERNWVRNRERRGSDRPS